MRRRPIGALLVAGGIMAFALWRSKKAQSVSDTEIRLAAHGGIDQRFSRSAVARGVVSAARVTTGAVKVAVPVSLRARMD